MGPGNPNMNKTQSNLENIKAQWDRSKTQNIGHTAQGHDSVTAFLLNVSPNISSWDFLQFITWNFSHPSSFKPSHHCYEQSLSCWPDRNPPVTEKRYSLFKSYCQDLWGTCPLCPVIIVRLCHRMIISNYTVRALLSVHYVLKRKQMTFHCKKNQNFLRFKVKVDFCELHLPKICTHWTDAQYFLLSLTMKILFLQVIHLVLFWRRI